MTDQPPLSNAPSGDQPRDRPPTPQPLASPAGRCT